jgi:hypothetical protein
LLGVILCVADPRHAIAADRDGDAADFVQQRVLVGGMDHRLVAGTAHAQGAVEAGEFEFRVVAAGEVGHAADHADGAPAAVADHRPAVQHIGVATVLAAKAVFGRPAFPPDLDRVVNALQHAIEVVGVKMLRPGAAVGRQFGRCVAEGTLQAFVPPDAVRRQVPVPDGVGNDARDGLEALLAFVQGLQNPLALGDVALHRHEVGEPASAVGNRDDVELEPDGVAGLGVVDEFAAERLPHLKCGADAVELAAVGERPL